MEPGTFKDVSGYIDGGAGKLNASASTDLAPFFSALSNGATATVASGDNRVLLVGNDAYAVYTVKADGTDAINTVIQITGVQGVSSFIGSDYLLS